MADFSDVNALHDFEFDDRERDSYEQELNTSQDEQQQRRFDGDDGHVDMFMGPPPRQQAYDNTKQRKKWNLGGQNQFAPNFADSVGCTFVNLAPDKVLATKPQLSSDSRQTQKLAQNPIPSGSSGSSGDASSSDPSRSSTSSALFQHKQYLAQLSQKAKEKKKLSEPDEKQKQLLERERGFNIYMSGANKDMAQKKEKKNKSQKKTGSKKYQTTQNAAPFVTEPIESVVPSTRFQQRRKEWKKERVMLRGPENQAAVAAAEELLFGAQAEMEEEFASMMNTSSSSSATEEQASPAEQIADAHELPEVQRSSSPTHTPRSSRKSARLSLLTKDEISFLRQSLSVIASPPRQGAGDGSSGLPQMFEDDSIDLSTLSQEQQASQETSKAQTRTQAPPGQNVSPALDMLIARMRGLDHTKQEMLLQFLTQLEQQSNISPSSPEVDDEESEQQGDSVLFADQDTDELDDEMAKIENIAESMNILRSTDSIQGTESSPSVLILRVVSTWGHDKTVELFGDRKKRIVPKEEDVKVLGALGGNGNVMKIFNGKSKTVSDQDMWQTSLPSLTYLEIQIRLSGGERLSGIRIWNYNRSVNESVKGVKELEVLLDGEQVWHGVVQRGCGNNVFDYSTTIVLDQDRFNAPEPSPAAPVAASRQAQDAAPSKQVQGGGTPIQAPKPIPARQDTTAQLPAPTSSPREQQAASSSKSKGESDGSFTFSKPAAAVPQLSLSKRIGSSQSSRAASAVPPSPKASFNTSNDSESALFQVQSQFVLAQPSSQQAHVFVPSPATSNASSVSSSTSGGGPIWLGNNRKLEDEDLVPSESIRVDEEDAQEEAKPQTRPARVLSARRTRRVTIDTPTPTDVAVEQAQSGVSPPQSNSLVSALTARARLGSRERARQPLVPERDAQQIKHPSQQSMSIGEAAANSDDEEEPKSRKEFVDPLMQFQQTMAQPKSAAQQEQRTHQVVPKLLIPNSQQQGSLFGNQKTPSAQSLSLANDSKGTTAQRKDSKEISSRQQLLQQLAINAGLDKAATFEIPQLPKGKKLAINIETTWGDPHYVGLTAIELFDQTGSLVPIKNPLKQVRADPADINILPEYNNDPRTVDKLFDGVNKTCDDLHMWLAPFTPGKNHWVFIELDTLTTLSMIRIWNYNKSRIHSYRGARHIQVTFDDFLVFKGEVRKATGTIWHAEDQAECILFTCDEDILANIEEFDERHYISEDHIDVQPQQPMGKRPKTASSSNQGGAPEDPALRASFNAESHFKNLNPLQRPMTAANNAEKQGLMMGKKSSPQLGGQPARAASALGSSRSARQLPQQLQQQQPAPVNVPLSSRGKIVPVMGQVIEVYFLNSWNDRYYVGLTGVQVLDTELRPLPLSVEQINAVPRDLNAISGHSGDYRTLDKLIDGVNITTDDHHMWLVPLTLVENPHLRIDLLKPTRITALQFYNYNKSLDDSFRGCKTVKIMVDGRCVSPPEGTIIRKAPGTAGFDFGQVVPLSRDAPRIADPTNTASIFQDSIREAIRQARSTGYSTPRQDYETQLLPCALTFKFELVSTLGDMYYIGLNGIELYDAKHNKITLTMDNLRACPRSIADEIAECKGDVRTLDKLIDGANTAHDGSHSWLAPFVPGRSNHLYVIFEEPVAISMIKIWNYSKTSRRGVNEMEIYADDVLLYKGNVRPANAGSEDASTSNQEFVQSILFTNDPNVYAREKKNIYIHSGRELDVQLWNNGQADAQIQRRGTMHAHLDNNHGYSSSMRPHTAVARRQS